jgi:hypothetical protein
LPHMGAGFPVLPALQSYLSHSHSIRRLYTACCPFFFTST